MYKIKADVPKNRLYITMIGTLSEEEAKKAKQSIEFSIASLKSGFDVINDISKFIHGEETAGAVLKEIIILLIKNGVRNVVRVIGTSKAGLIQFANNSLQIEQYKLSYVPTLEEAEKLLEKANELPS